MLNYSSYYLVITPHLLTALAPDSVCLSALNPTMILKENIPPTPTNRNGANNEEPFPYKRSVILVFYVVSIR